MQADKSIAASMRNSGLPDLFHDRTVISFISLDEDKLGRIRRVTSNIEQVLGYNYQDSTNMDISEIMPKQVAAVHNDILKKYLERNDYRKIKRQFDTWAVDRS